jgi:hypothetical protein
MNSTVVKKEERSAMPMTLSVDCVFEDESCVHDERIRHIFSAKAHTFLPSNDRS